jgi:(2Fe-2S) ferredoxin
MCVNKRPNGTGCGTVGADSVFKETKQAFAGQKSHLRINSSGCLGHCVHGPVLVVYPEASWYSYFDGNDVVKIVNAHLQGKIESDLLLQD